MKELSIEEKAKCYDEAKLRMSAAYNSNRCTIGFMNEIFPELKESEDERIRKSLIILLQYFCKGYRVPGLNFPVSYTEMLAWLEEQGKNNMGISEATKKKLEDNLNKALEKETPESFNEFLDEQGEQKPDNELKFEIGDLITNGILVGKIDEIHELGYHAYFGDHYADVPDVENWHKWTIQDAKDGDVLVCESGWTCIFKALDNHTNTFSSYCFMDSDKWFCNTGSECHTLDKEFMKAYNGDIKPATKEQRDTLMKAMADAGYTFDFEKKELKKIEQKQVIDYPDSLPKDNWELVHEFVSKFGRVPKDEDELNVLVEYVLKRKNHSEWSEEDEQYKSGLIGLVENSKAGLPINLRGKAADKCIYWLKSLKDRYTWKPSDEQMHYLSWIANIKLGDSVVEQEVSKHLNELLEDLKKLREE